MNRATPRSTVMGVKVDQHCPYDEMTLRVGLKGRLICPCCWTKFPDTRRAHHKDINMDNRRLTASEKWDLIEEAAERGERLPSQPWGWWTRTLVVAVGGVLGWALVLWIGGY
jgi:uncharacterized Zn finger protein (UPF0148 family)